MVDEASPAHMKRGFVVNWAFRFERGFQSLSVIRHPPNEADSKPKPNLKVTVNGEVSSHFRMLSGILDVYLAAAESQISLE